MPAFLFVKYEIIILNKLAYAELKVRLIRVIRGYKKNEWLSKYKDNDEDKIYNHERAVNAIVADQLL